MKKVVALSVKESDFDYERQIYSARTDTEFSVSAARTKADVIRDIHDADVVLFTDITFDREVLDSLDSCKLIIRYGIGYDNIDTKYAAQRGIIVCNAPNYGVLDVAEHAMSLLLSCAKSLTFLNDCVRDDRWNDAIKASSVRLYGKTVGFVGFGKIARCVCERTSVFGMSALVYDPYVSAEVLERYHAKAAALDELLAQSDYVTLHLPLSDSTRHMFGAEQFAGMKRSAVLINTSRGGLVKESELVDALEQGVIAGAGLDVFENEGTRIDPRLFKMPRVTLTPHVAWNTYEGAEALHREVTANVTAYLDGKRPESIVNGL